MEARVKGRWGRAVVGCAIAACLLGGPAVASAVGPAPARALSLAQLRTAVDDVAAQLEAERATARDELGALRAERAELERQVRAAQARAATLKALADEADERAQVLSEQSTRWHEPTAAALAAARAYVERTLPFAKEQRLAALSRIERDLKVASPDHARAVERLLRFIEEEEAMGQQATLIQHKLEFEGQVQIVDVLRLSMAMMYIRTSDGRLGWAYPGADGFRIEAITDPALAQVVAERFDAHEDNRGLGPAQLVLPVPLPAPQAP